MKITNIRTFLMHAGAPDPTRWASDRSSTAPGPTTPAFGTRNWLFLKIDTDEGIGECSGWPRVVETAIHDLARYFSSGAKP